MNKTIKWIGGLVIILVVIVLITSQQSGQTNITEPIKIGVITPLTGDYSIVGEEVQKGIELAVSQLGKQGVKISVVCEDDQLDPKNTVTAANKLITIDKVDFVVVFSVEEAKPIFSLFNNAKIPLLVLFDSNNAIKSAGPYIFSNGFSTEKTGELMADYAFNTLKLKKIAIVSHVDEWSKIITESFKNKFIDDGGVVVYNDSVQIGTSDFRSIILKIKNAKPDGIYFPLIPFDAIDFIKQINQYNISVPMLSGDGLFQSIIDAVGKLSDNIYYTNGYLENSDLLQLYKSKYQKYPDTLLFVASGYDGILKVGKSLSSSKNIKTIFDNIFGLVKTADRIEKIYRVESGKSIEVK